LNVKPIPPHPDNPSINHRVVAQCTAPGTGLPEDKPRYVMGIGYPLDIVICSALGADMYDSVYPTRTARFGVALVPEGVLKPKNSQYGGAQAEELPVRGGLWVSDSRCKSPEPWMAIVISSFESVVCRFCLFVWMCVWGGGGDEGMANGQDCNWSYRDANGTCHRLSRAKAVLNSRV